ncbi:MAG: hypothetical protein QXM16_09250 [Nitrososphaerota archaeon]
MLRHVIGFILGGIVFLILQPILSGIALVGLLGLILLILLVFIPGGWIILLFFRSAVGLFRRVLMPLIALMAASLIVYIASMTLGSAVGAGLSFLIGGLAGLLIASKLHFGPRLPALRRAQTGIPGGGGWSTAFKNLIPRRSDVPVVAVRGGLFSRRAGLSSQAFRSGIIVFGEAARPVVRTLVKGALEVGERVVIIGSPYMAAPRDGTRLIPLEKTRVNLLNVSGDRLSIRRWAENIAIPLAVSTGLDTAEVGMLVRFLEKFAGVRLTPDDVDKLVAEYGPTSSARLKDALGLVSTFFGEENPEAERVFRGEWSQLILDMNGLSPAIQLFIGMYLLYEAPRLFPGCVVVFDGAEMGLPEQQLLPYDARLVWLRTLKTVERLREGGFIMISSTGLLAPELLDLADTYIVTRGPSHLRRGLSERIGAEIDIAGMPVGQAVVFTRATPSGESYLFRGEIIQTPLPDIRALREEAEREGSLLAVEKLQQFRETMLYAEFSDACEAAYRVLKSVKTLSTPTTERVVSATNGDASRILRMLEEKQYIVRDPAGVLGLSTLGEHALRDWEARVRRVERGEAVAAAQAGPRESGMDRGVKVQAGLSAYRRETRPRTDFGDVVRLVNRARQMLIRGDSLLAVGAAYKAAVTALKRVAGLEKGHLPDLAERAAEKGVISIDVEEARRLYAANIESKRLLEQASEGVHVSEEDRKRMADAAELLISLAERIMAFTESIPEPEEESRGGEGG